MTAGRPSVYFCADNETESQYDADPMRGLRRFLFWCHLAAGSLAGAVIFAMCATGVLLAFQPQILRFVERGVRRVPETARPHSTAEPIAAGTLLRLAAEASPGNAPTAVTVSADPAEAAAVAFGRERTLFLDRSTGAVLGSAASGWRKFFGEVQDIHRWLAFSENGRPAGKAITGAANLLFFGLALSGLYIWWPRLRGIRRISSVGLFQRGLSGKARDFNWHNVIGVWTALPLLVITLTGMVISYRWAGDLVYRAFGDAPPPAPNAGGRPGRRKPGHRGSPSHRRRRRRARRSLAHRRETSAGLAGDHPEAPGERQERGHVLDRGRALPQPFRPLLAHARREVGRGHQVGAVRRSRRRPPGPLLDAVPPHRGIARSPRPARRGPRVPRRRGARRDRDRSLPPTPPGLARPARGRDLCFRE